MKKQQLKSMNIVFIIFLFVITAAFFACGIYITKVSLDYIGAYQSGSYVSDMDIIKYVIDSSILYFGLGIVTLIGAIILISLNRMQKNIQSAITHMNNRRSSSYDYGEKYLKDDGQQLELPLKDSIGKTINR